MANALIRQLTDPAGLRKFLDLLTQKFREFITSIKIDLIVAGQRRVPIAAFSNLPGNGWDTILGRAIKHSELKKLNSYGVTVLKSVNEKGKYLVRSTVIDDLGNQLMDANEVQRFVDNIDTLADQWKLRKAALTKWSEKLIDLSRHFDGEIKIRKRKGKEYFEAQGAHNVLVNGSKIKITTIRKPIVESVFDLPHDVPFLANVQLIYENRYLDKKALSSFFPMNWTYDRVRGEIAFIYENLINLQIDFQTPPFKYVKFSSDGSFQIQLEINEKGNIVNAYPNIKL
ncbi:MAG: hypothetical protein WBG46_03020 [Nonlabens sp.]